MPPCDVPKTPAAVYDTLPLRPIHEMWIGERDTRSSLAITQSDIVAVIHVLTSRRGVMFYPNQCIVTPVYKFYYYNDNDKLIFYREKGFPKKYNCIKCLKIILRAVNENRN